MIVGRRGDYEGNTSLLGGHVEVHADSTGWAEQVNSADYTALAKKTFEEEREALKRLNLRM